MMNWVTHINVHISAVLILLVAGNKIQEGGVKFNFIDFIMIFKGY